MQYPHPSEPPPTVTRRRARALRTHGGKDVRATRPDRDVVFWRSPQRPPPPPTPPPAPCGRSGENSRIGSCAGLVVFDVLQKFDEFMGPGRGVVGAGAFGGLQGFFRVGFGGVKFVEQPLKYPAIGFLIAGHMSP